MKFLIITQKLDQNDAVLGFMHGWIFEFARQAESVLAICLEQGSVAFPGNVKVLSLGKEKKELGIGNYGLFKKGKYVWNFLRYIARFRNDYDAVFVHMNPEYILIGGWFWKLLGKTVTLWYAHKSVPWHLRAAHFFTDIIFTSTASGFRLPSGKVKVIGQGIDTDRFKIKDSSCRNEGGTFKIVTVGRITPSKDYETLIDAIEIVRKNSAVNIGVEIVGPISTSSDGVYLARLKEKITQKDLAGFIKFTGPVSNKDLPKTLEAADLFVNMGHTGSMDKAVPEAMAVGLPVLTCNEAFKDVLGPYTGDLMYPKGDFGALAGKIRLVMEMASDDRRNLGQELRAIVVRGHGLEQFVKKIIGAINLFQNHGR